MHLAATCERVGSGRVYLVVFLDRYIHTNLGCLGHELQFDIKMADS